MALGAGFLSLVPRPPKEVPMANRIIVVAMVVALMCAFAAAQEKNPADELNSLRAENAMLKATIEQKNK